MLLNGSESGHHYTTEEIDYLDVGLLSDDDEDSLKRTHTAATDQQYKRWLLRLTSKGYLSDYPDGLVRLHDDDPRRPLNWTFRKRIFHTLMYGITTLTVQVGASVISPGVSPIAREFGVGTEVGILAFSVFIIGNMIGPAIFAPISEVFGRKIGVLVPCFMCGVALLMCANVSSIAALVVFRFIAGILGAAPIVSSGGAMSDMWRANQRAAALVLYSMHIFAGAVMAPVLGALLVRTGPYGWRWALWLGGLLAMAVSGLNLVFLSESYWPVVEQRAVRKYKLATGYWVLHVDHDKWTMSLQEFITVHFARPIYILGTPIVFLMVLYGSFMYGLLFMIITSVDSQFRAVHHFSFVASYTPLFGLFSGYLVGGSMNVMSSRRYAKIAAKIQGRPEPEERLMAVMMFAWCMPCGMMLYGWTMKTHIHWIVPCFGLAVTGVGIAVVFQGSIVYLTDVYTKYSASAIASNTIVRSLFGGVFPLFANQMFAAMGVHWAATLLAFVGLALCPVPWVFYAFGKRIRQHDPFKQMLEI